jgi:hypothetical protein
MNYSLLLLTLELEDLYSREREIRFYLVSLE